jgi:hypothetical protein
MLQRRIWSIPRHMSLFLSFSAAISCGICPRHSASWVHSLPADLHIWPCKASYMVPDGNGSYMALFGSRVYTYLSSRTDWDMHLVYRRGGCTGQMAVCRTNTSPWDSPRESRDSTGISIPDTVGTHGGYNSNSSWPKFLCIGSGIHCSSLHSATWYILGWRHRQWAPYR